MLVPCWCHAGAAAAHQLDGGTGEAAWSSRCRSPRWPGGKCCRPQPPPAWLCADRSASVWTRWLFCPILLIWTLLGGGETKRVYRQPTSCFFLLTILLINKEKTSVFQTTLTYPGSSGNGCMLRFYWSSSSHVIHVPATHWSTSPWRHVSSRQEPRRPLIQSLLSLSCRVLVFEVTQVCSCSLVVECRDKYE